MNKEEFIKLPFAEKCKKLVDDHIREKTKHHVFFIAEYDKDDNVLDVIECSCSICGINLKSTWYNKKDVPKEVVYSFNDITHFNEFSFVEKNNPSFSCSDF